MIFVFIKCEIYLCGEDHHKTYSTVSGRMPWAQDKILCTIIFIQLELDLIHTLHAYSILKR